MKPLVSVIVPLYNAAPYITETLESILQSTYRPLEVIVMDDGSTDESLRIAQQWALAHPECRVLSQANAGVSAARNHAIREAQGQYILPVDADDLIGSTYIEHAVAAIEERPEIRVVGCQAMMFGAVHKPWQLPPFSHALLARKNMIPVTSLFRKADWQRCGGFCEENIYREDWDFWLSMFELGGDYHLLPEVGLHYRVRPGSRRAGAKQQKRIIVDAINRRHPAYMRRYLGGPLHYHRSWSRLINMLRSERGEGQFEHYSEGEVIFSRRNTIRIYGDYAIKQFATPAIWRGILYGLLVPSKAKRSYQYAQRMHGFTPEPIAYREVRIAGILRESWYVCRRSECPYTFNDLIGNPAFPNRDIILEAIGRFTARLHQQGIWPLDYSGGNILFNSDGSRIEVIDLNRTRFRLPDEPLIGFERLNIDRQALRTMVYAYADQMGRDREKAADYVIAHRWHKHVKQGITNL